MAKIQSVGKKVNRIANTALRAKRLEPEEVAAGLGAETTDVTAPPRSNPIAMQALRRELADRLVSTGGRCGLEDATRRQKIPLADDDWQHLQRVARVVGHRGLRATPGQVASVLIRQHLHVLLGPELPPNAVVARIDFARGSTALQWTTAFDAMARFADDDDHRGPLPLHVQLCSPPGNERALAFVWFTNPGAPHEALRAETKMEIIGHDRVLASIRLLSSSFSPGASGQDRDTLADPDRAPRIPRHGAA